MANMIKCRVIVQIKDSTRGSFQKMLVVRTPFNFNTSCGFIRQHGADGMVLAYQANGIKPHLAQDRGGKIWEFDEGLCYFPLKANTAPFQIDAEIHGSNLVVHHLPPEIFSAERYTQVDAHSQIPKEGPPVRIMRDITLRLSTYPVSGHQNLSVTMDRKLADTMQKVLIKSFNKSGFQIYRTEEGRMVTQNLSDVSGACRFSQGLLPFRLPKSNIPSFTIAAKFDEASQSIICEDGYDRLMEQHKIAPAVGQKGGKSRAETLGPERLREIASIGAKARWAKHKHSPHEKGKANTDIIGLVALLEKHFKDGVFDIGYDDTRIANEAGMARDFVTKIREMQFGKIRNPNKAVIDDIKKKMEALQKQLADLDT